jgi:DNA-binding transcriptional regulator YiaG
MTGDELRTTRERLGLSQTALAERLGTRQNRISDWETGRRDVPIHAAAHLRTLARLHDCERRGG